MTFSITLWFALASGGVGVLYALATAVWVSRKDPGSDKLRSIADTIKAGGKSFFRREFLALTLLVTAIALPMSHFLGPWIGNGFLGGALGAVLAGYLGSSVATRASVRTAEAAKDGLAPALTVAFKGGSAVGLSSASLALLGIAGYYTLARWAIPADDAFRALLGLGLGGSVVSVFTRIAGGIYSKAARIGATAASESEENIAEDDPRNPALIANAAGSNVGHGAGVAADLYETFTLALLAAMLLAKTVFGADSAWVEFPLAIGGASLVVSILGGLFVRLGKRKRILGALYRSLFVTGLLAGGAFYGISWEFLSLPGVEPAFDLVSLFATLFTGLVLTGFIVLISEYYTSASFKPVKGIAAASADSDVGNLIAGLAVGSKSTLLPVIAASTAIVAAYYFGGGFSANPWAGLFAVALSVVASLALASPLIALNSYSAIAENASGIAELAELYERRRSVTAPLAAVGVTTQAVAKGYAIVTAGLAALALFAEYSRSFSGAVSFDLANPAVVAGLFIGGLLPYWLAARVLNAVGVAAGRATSEVGRQLQLPGIAEGTSAPQYVKIVDLLSKSAVRQTFVPVLALVAVPMAVGLLVGKEALGGFLIGLIITGLFQSIAMVGSGGAWNNARRYIEGGMFGGRRSPAHGAAITGDALGNTYKDAVGPAINSLVKLANIVALLAVPLLA